MINYALPNSKESVLASTNLLFEELQVVNSIDWNADRETILSWNKTEAYHDAVIHSDEKGLKTKCIIQSLWLNLLFLFYGKGQNFL